MKLYIGNCSKQRRELYYRIPGDNPHYPHKRLDILPGQQGVIPYEFNKIEAEEFLRPHLMYGWVDAKTLSQGHSFVGVCYSFDKPISENLLSYTIESNDGHLDDAAKEELKRFAASNEALLDSDPNAPIKQIDVCVEDTQSAPDAPDAPLRADGMTVIAKRRARAR